MVRMHFPELVPLVALLATLTTLSIAWAAVRLWRGTASRWQRVGILAILWLGLVGATIQSGATTDLWTIDTVSKAGRVTLYDIAGNPLGISNRAAVLETAGGAMGSGKDYKIARTQRMSSIGTQRTTDNALYLYDSFEGTTRNLEAWIETVTTMASAQAVATGLTLNSASTTTTTTGILESSHRQFPLIARTGVLFRAHARLLGVTNCVEELGFSDQTSATVALSNNGAFFRRDSAGSLQPVLAFNGAETQGTVMAGPATTEYATYEVFVEDDRATFQITSHAGVLLSSQVMEIGSSGGGAGSTTQARMFTNTHIPAMLRVYNTGAAGTAPQIIVNRVTVQLVDADLNRSVQVQQAGTGYDGFTSPTAFTQLANYGNSAAPTARTLSNTACAEATLGGLVRANSIAGAAATDLCLIGWQNPSPYTFYVTRVRISPPINEVVAVATTATTWFPYFMATNSSAASLATAAPYSPMRKPLSCFHTGAVALAVSSVFSGTECQWDGIAAVQPGRFLHLGTRELVGTATATETYQWTITVDGFFE